MILRQAAFALAVVALIGCSSRDRAQDSIGADSSSIRGTLTHGSTPGAAKIAVLSATAGDSIYLVPDGDDAHLVWRTQREAGWQQVWQSRPLLGAVPDVRIDDFDRDGRSDLFWTFEHEGVAGAMIVFQVSSGTVEAFPPTTACVKPTLKSVGGQQVLEQRTSGAYSEEDCADPVVRTCIDATNATWPEHYEVDGESLRKINETAEYYRGLAKEYKASADMLTKLIADNGTLLGKNIAAANCGKDIPKRLLALADSALSLSTKQQ